MGKTVNRAKISNNNFSLVLSGGGALGIAHLGVLKDFGNIKPIPQTEALATYAKKITKKDALISFDDAKKTYAKYKAFYFWPGINLKSGLKLKEIRFLENESFNEEGKILKTDKEGAFIGCKRGTLKLLRIQPPSKKEMGIIEYMRGKRIKVGDYLS
jgi:methionyl-tRNA formyltransferase